MLSLRRNIVTHKENMKNKAVVVLVILGSLIISIFAGCRQSPLKYIPPTIDSVNNDKSRMGLNGKVKTLDIYYYRPENIVFLFDEIQKRREMGRGRNTSLPFSFQYRRQSCSVQRVRQTRKYYPKDRLYL